MDRGELWQLIGELQGTSHPTVYSNFHREPQRTWTMTLSVARLGMNLLLCSVAIPAIAAQSEQTSPPGAVPPPPAATHAPLTIVEHSSSNVFREVDPSASGGVPAADEQGAKAQNRFRFVTGEEANEYSRRLKERLTDPEQRAALRAEQRAVLMSQNAGVGRLVGLDPATEQKLIELLTDQQMERLDQVHMQPRPTVPDLQQYADQATQRMNALRDLLGDEKLERFRDFELSQSERHWVSRLAARLAPAYKLQPDQEDQLTALKHEQFQTSSAAMESWRVFRRPLGQLTSLEEMQRESQRQSRIANENSWRKRQVENPLLEQKAAAFLTPVQLAELSRYHAEEQDTSRRYVESARAEAGLDPKIPEQAEVAEETPKLIEAQLQIEVSLTVNREPATVTRTVRNGESFTFEVAQGLTVEATPTMYGDDWIEVHLKYYEDRTNGRRRLSGGSISVAQARQPDGSLSSGGSSGTVITGRKGYAVETKVNARVL
ncbi:hypothetical protein [Peristeroidobacter agariperforans]|uniref:hypothetical protein n=1 Tax=Peristeroidobacter agariperforans TaxID=268404 RepID=UPI00101D50CE|nr:hypothetical protein [Peristeroidobacter agariperforans]